MTASTSTITMPDPPTRVIQDGAAGGLWPAAASLIISVATSADLIRPWGYPPRDRDLQLAAFWPTEDYFSSALFTMVAQYTSFGFTLKGPKRMVSYSQSMLNQVEFGGGWEALLEPFLIDLWCLGPKTRVTLGGSRRGKEISIKEMVDSKDPGPVLSWENGHLTERLVTEWHTTPLGPRHWVWISAEYSSGHSGNRPGGVWCTNDHPWLTPQGWVLAGDLRTGDKIVSGLPSPSPAQRSLIAGAMLGDACISKTNGKSAVLRLSHSEKQREWLELKRDALRGFSWTPLTRRTQAGGFGGGTTGSFAVNSQSTPSMLEWHRRWYVWRDGRWFKRVDRETVEQSFSPLLLAVWYGDDGSKTSYGPVELSTYGFDEDDVVWLADLLTSHGYTAKAACYGGGPSGPYMGIRLTFEGSRRLCAAVAPFLPECLRYKLHGVGASYDSSLWQLPSAEGYVDTLVAVEHKPLRAGYSGIAQTTYSIGVEGTRCFSAGNLISHNTADNGGFLEIVRADNNDPSSPCLSLNHLDSRRCVRTGRRDEPVIYIDTNGNWHTLKWFNVISMTEFPSPMAETLGIGHCALSRLLRTCQTQRDRAIINQEKASGRFTRQVHLVSGVATRTIEDAIATKKLMAEAEGFSYIQPLILGSLDPTARVSKETIDLASVPADYNESEALHAYIITLAMAFGTDYENFSPLTGRGAMGSGGGQSKTMNMRSRGKGPRLFMQKLQRVFNFHGILPRSVSFEFGEHDIAEQMEKTELSRARALELEILVRAGIITTEVARQMAVDSGDLDERYLIMMHESNSTDEILATSVDPIDLRPDEGVTPGLPGPAAPPLQTNGAVPRPINSNQEIPRPPSRSHLRVPGGPPTTAGQRA